ncbi:MAG: hypothetical protein RSD67_03020 [Oscillospiraceae bacterium]
MLKIIVPILVAVLLVGSGCSTRQKSTDEIQSASDTVSTSSSNYESSISEQSSSSEVSENPINDELLRDILINYGANKFPDEGEKTLIEHKSGSLFSYEDDWDETHPMPNFNYYIWNLGQLWNEDISYEERVEKYANPSGKENVGWFFPQDIYESRVMQYFDVTTELLRSSEEYDAKYQGYSIYGGGGIGEKVQIKIFKTEQIDDILKLHITLVSNEYNRKNYENKYKILSVRLAEDGSYKYIGCITEKNPSQEQIDSSFSTMQDIKTGEKAQFTSDELKFTITLPSNWENNYTTSLTDMGFQGISESGKSVGFYYKGDTATPLLYINAVPITVWEQVKEKQLEHRIKLGENDKYVFTAMPWGGENPFKSGKDKELYDSMYIDIANMNDKVKFQLN